MLAHLRIIPGNVAEIFTQTPWLLIIVAWYVALWKLGSARFGPVSPPSTFLLLFAPAVCGIAFYCLVRMETRYISSFLFLGFAALTVSLRYPSISRKAAQWAVILSGVLICFFLAIVAHSLVDQSIRGLRSTQEKPSYREAFEHHVALKDFLLPKGLKRGDYVAVVGGPPLYWARMTGVQIVVEVNSEADFLGTTPDARQQAIQAVKGAGVRAVIAKGSAFGKLLSEGWILVPGTRDYYVFLLPSSTAPLQSNRVKGQGEKRL
jgi:hypothetical protein